MNTFALKLDRFDVIVALGKCSPMISLILIADLVIDAAFTLQE
jgi:hypothetical protein